MSQETTQIELTNREAELFKKFRQYQSKWERFFTDEFVGSLTLHKGENNPKIEFEWRVREE